MWVAAIARAVLKEALVERELLIREVHHRIKNNIQILLGMLSASEHEVDHPEAKRILSYATRRLSAMGAAEQALYSSDRLTVHRGDELLQLPDHSAPHDLAARRRH